MAERDDDEQKPTIDLDRAAILARRQRFIALALTGLSTTACTTGDNKSTGTKGDTKGEVTAPHPCLKKVAPEEGGEPAPQPCLSVPIQEPPPETPPPEPQVCLKMAPPEPQPQPCLKKPAPKPCLKQAAPKPCLNMVEVKNDEEPT